MFDSGFRGKYEPAPVLVEFDRSPARAAPPVDSPAAKPGGEDSVRRFVNDERNSRAAFPVSAKALRAAASAELEPTLKPFYLILSGDRVAAQGNALVLFDLNLKPAGRVTGGFGEAVAVPAKGLFYAAQQSGLLAGLRLANGAYHYGVELMFGPNYERTYFARRGNRIAVVSAEKMVNPHADKMPELATVELHALGEPEGPAGIGRLTPSNLEVSLIRKGLPVHAAANGEQIAVVSGDQLFTFDWGLKFTGWVADQFRATQISLDERGLIYLAVEEKGDNRSALWVLDRSGKRYIRYAPAPAADALIAPPIVGYDHTIYLLTADTVTAVSSKGERLWSSAARSNFAGAVATPDGKLIAADGAEIVSLGRDGERAVLFTASEPITTAPLIAADNRVYAASAKRVFRLEAESK